MSYALAAPKIPSDYELQQNKELSKLNSDNPYLRSGDSSLLSQVVIAQLSDPSVAEELEATGLGNEFTIAPVANLGMGLVKITGTANTADIAVETARVLGKKFQETIKVVQEVNDADSSYLYSALPVQGPGPAEELYSSRLRSLIMVGIAGAVLLFGAVSIAQSISIRKVQRRAVDAAEQVAVAQVVHIQENLGGYQIDDAKSRYRPIVEPDSGQIFVTNLKPMQLDEHVVPRSKKVSGGSSISAKQSDEKS
ncbi:hypothetical protein [Arthrobacter sp. MYb227]|uniref:hypothetical protein n=1 Tax=Arthrobacter sp. MYb227 TaxID=1848601 RepID=UPI000CFC826E|nr:hypothetical protein [Arthrobacter sp. MYb227]